MKSVCVVGEGAWGTAIATLLAYNGFSVRLWCHDPLNAKMITEEHSNTRYMPGVILHDHIYATTDFAYALQDVSLIFEAIPVQFLRSVMQQIKPYIQEHHAWVILSKGMEQDTLSLPTAIIDDLLSVQTKKAILAGPSFARELIDRQKTAVMLACHDQLLANEIKEMVCNDYFVVHNTQDVTGVQMSAALKNVITLGIGMFEGAGYGDNTIAYCITQGLHEIVQLVIMLGGKEETVYGLAGIGDLFMTATSKSSRNLHVGRLLGQGKSLNAVLQETGYIPEGINSIQSLNQLIKKHQLNLPLCQGIYDIIYRQRSGDDVLNQLMKIDR